MEALKWFSTYIYSILHVLSKAVKIAIAEVYLHEYLYGFSECITEGVRGLYRGGKA